MPADLIAKSGTQFAKISVLSGLLLLSTAQAFPHRSALAQSAEQAPGGSFRAPADFTEIVRRLSPSVVGVTTRAAVDDATRDGIFGDGPFRDFFRRHFGEPGEQFRGPRRRGALGSGFVIDEAGHVVTNNHVVANAQEIRIVMGDGTTHPAKLVGRDPATDIAVLRFEKQPPNVRPLTWGDSSAMQPGAWTIAIGSPFGLGGTVTVGVLSARSRNIQAGPYDDFLQTDASINSGNSGGPLFNDQGRVIGVNTAIFSPSGGNVGIGFAIASDLARNIVTELIQKGQVERGYIGATLQQITPELASSFGLDQSGGALVASVERAAPAARAGLQPGDVIVQFNGKPVTGVRELTRAVASSEAGQRVQAQVIRDGRRVDISLPIERRPDVETAQGQGTGESGSAMSNRLGVALAPVDGATRQRSGMPAEQTGVLVQQVAPDSPAAESGLRAGDIIVSAGNSAVDDPSDVSRYWQQQSSRGDVAAVFRVRRGDSYLFIAVKPS